MRAISAFSLLAGTSTRVCLADTPLRRRASMSEMGSVISLFLPGALDHAGHAAFERQLAEAQTAHVELAHERARPTAQLAAIAVADLVLQRLRFFGYLCRRRHISSILTRPQGSGPRPQCWARNQAY